MATLNAESIQRYKGSAPINFRLIAINLFVVLGCSYVLVTSLTRYDAALTDLDTVAKTSVLGATPCGMAVPKLKFLFQSLKEIGDDAFSEDQEADYIEGAKNAMCGQSSAHNAIRSALGAPELPDDCCSAYNTADSRYKSPTELNEAVKDYVCACGTETCTNGNGYGDMIRRIHHAYVLAAPAFAVYVDSDNNGNTCLSPNDPFSDTSCATDAAAIRQNIHAELVAAATNSFKILAGKSAAEAPWPTVSQMLFRIMALAIVEFHDRKNNNGGCFSNSAATPTAAVQFCTDKLAASMAIPDASVTRPLGDAWPGGCADASEHKYYDERVRNADSCTWTAATDSVSGITPLWTQRPRKFSDAYAEQGTLPVYAICSSMLEFGLLDRKRLFGLPDPIGEYEFYAEHLGSSFSRWLAGWGYWGLFDANKDKAQVSDKHTAYLELKLYLGYRFAVTSAWVMAALIACGYLLAFAAVPFAKLLYVRFVRRSFTNTPTDTIITKPPGFPEYVALSTTALVGLWVIFVDPASPTPYVTTTSCADYAMHGGPFSTIEHRSKTGLLGMALVLLGFGFLLYSIACRRSPKKQRIMPLSPFPIFPLIGLIFVVLFAVLLLMIRAGNDWWERESKRLDGSTTKTTTDFEEIVGAAVWILLCLGLLTGLLNQRSMVANLMLNVPRGRIPVFAYIWVGSGLAVAIVAAVFAWPLFDCSAPFTSNELVCGDGTEITIIWNAFWGCIAYVACICAILFVVFASYKVLFTTPRKDDPETKAFNRSKDAEIAALNTRRLGTTPPVAPVGTNPFGTAATAATATGGLAGAAVVASGAAVLDDGFSDDDYDVYAHRDVPETDAEAPSAEPPDRLKFNLGGAFAKPVGNVLAEAKLLPLEGFPVAASFHATEHEAAPLLPQQRALV